uniref:PepSY-associated TM helix domain-containing protein n=1 Tax=Polaribacter sp. TaxID=1920175 RepID=UPI004048813B
MKVTNRSLHRDFAYFYVGLIIAFSLSGIILNHRQDWYPMDYTFDTKELSIKLPTNPSEINKDYLIAAIEGMDLTYESHRIRDGKLRIYFKDNGIFDTALDSGKGLIEFKRKVPLIGHSMYLHKTTNSFWVWYSDIFGASLMLIAITGILIPAGKNGFSKRGWKLALAGIIFPLIFLFFLS